jgi:uncharacterized protein GlcG (DUF336 family)
MFEREIAAATAALAVAFASPAQAGDGKREVASVRTLSTELAREAAEAAFEACSRQGFLVTVSVVGRDGALLALVRDERATTASVDSATGKAYASASFRAPSGNLGDGARTNPGILQMPRFVVLRGGLPISSGGEVVGAIGVGGAPGGDIDEGCARAGVDRIANHL